MSEVLEKILLKDDEKLKADDRIEEFKRTGDTIKLTYIKDNGETVSYTIKKSSK